jgi:hypothetical protein
MHHAVSAIRKGWSRMRTFVAILIVPVVVMCGLYWVAAFNSGIRFQDVPSAVIAVVAQYVIFLAFTSAVVLPLRYLWRRWDFMRAWVAAAIGSAIVGSMMFVIAFVFRHIPATASHQIAPVVYWRGTIILAFTGAIAGLFFWLIAKTEMRPNNRA